MKGLTSVIGISIVFVYAIGSGLWVNTGDNWYRSLNPPSWQPPDFIFGIIWPYNFIVLGIAAVTIAQKASAGRLGEPEELAATLIWLVSDASSYVTGITVPVDGGLVMP